MMRLQLGFPDQFSFINPENYYQFVTMHGMIMVIYLLTALFLGGFGNYLIPLMWVAGHGVPVHEHAQRLGLSAVGHYSGRQFLRARRRDRCRLDLVSAAGDIAGNAGHRLGHRADAAVARRIHRGIHDGRPELRHHRAAGPLQGHDPDAHAAVGLGHLHGDDSRPAGIPGAAGQRHHDVVRQDCSAPASSCRP